MRPRTVGGGDELFIHRLTHRDFEVRMQELEAATRLWDQAVRAIVDAQGGRAHSSVDSDDAEPPRSHGQDRLLEIWTLSGDLPQVFRASIFLSAFALLERLVVDVAKAVQEANDPKAKEEDLRDSGILGAARYLKRVAHQPFPYHAPEWHRIQAYRHARNLFAHQFGTTNGSRFSSVAAAETGQLPGVTLSAHQIRLGVDFLPHVFSTFRAFSTCLADTIPATGTEPTCE